MSYAREALRAAVDDPSVLVNASVALSYFGEDVQAAMALMDRGLHANPSFAYGWLWSGVLRMMAGLPDTAIEHLGRCSRLNPRERVLAALTPMGICYLFKREFDKAVAILQASIQERPGYAQSYRALAAPVMPIWAGSTRRARSSSALGR